MKKTNDFYLIKAHILALFISAATFTSCGSGKTIMTKADPGTSKFLSKPLVTHIYTADPSAHVFGGKIIFILHTI